MRATDFGAFSFATAGFYAADIDDPNDLESRLIAIPGADGAYDGFGLGQSPKPARVVRVSFGIEPTATITIDQQLDLLLKEIHKGQQLLTVKMSDNSTRQALAKCIRLPRPHGHGSKHFLELAADFELQDPYWYDTNLTIENFNTSNPTANFSTSNIGGTAPIKKCLILIHRNRTNPRLTNNTNGWWFEFTGTILSLGSLWLDCALLTATNDGADVFGSISIAATQVGFMRLELGVNSFTLTGGTFTSDVSLRYRKVYH